MDIIHHRDREFFQRENFMHEMIIIIFLLSIFVGYYALIASLGIGLEP
ncbi:MAG: hypothetical protein ACI9SB_001907 [Candidatus Azotimanducaceae bacterium]|jgi:hypothetical protein